MAHVLSPPWLPANRVTLRLQVSILLKGLSSEGNCMTESVLASERPSWSDQQLALRGKPPLSQYPGLLAITKANTTHVLCMMPGLEMPQSLRQVPMMPGNSVALGPRFLCIGWTIKAIWNHTRVPAGLPFPGPCYAHFPGPCYAHGHSSAQRHWEWREQSAPEFKSGLSHLIALWSHKDCQGKIK